ncbi:glycosyltransferase [Roseateles sp.]|uniref:glycosyltransferase n=1 Tax=Roseateles sp. TaxID=1971397 RepID=UPI003BA648CD
MANSESSEKNRKVLFLTYLFPPIANSGTRRSLEFANRLPDLGWTPLVVAGVPEPDEYEEGLLSEVRPGTTVRRVPLGADQLGLRIGRFLRSDRIGAGLSWRIRALWAIPDYCISWRAGAIAEALALHKTHGFDVIYASGWPWSSFLIAEELSRRTGKPFVIDYRDLWGGTGADFERPRGIHRWIKIGKDQQRRVQARAAALVTTTSTFAQMLSEACGGRHVHAITNGFAKEDFPGFAPVCELPSTGPVKISYTGIWRPGYGPNDLYSAIVALKAEMPDLSQRLQVTMAGFKPGKAAEDGIEDVVTELGRVSHERALEIMRESDALYLPVSGGVYDLASLPGKIFEYVGSGRRIIASATPGSEVRRVLEAVGLYRAVVPGDISGLSGLLKGLVNRTGMEQFGLRDPAAVARYERSSQAAALAKVFDGLGGS